MVEAYFGDFDDGALRGVPSAYFADDHTEDAFAHWFQQQFHSPEVTHHERTLEELMQWVKSTATHHRDPVGFAHPPEVPFVVRFDPRSGIFSLTYSNIMCIDIDEKDSLNKEQAATHIRHCAELNGLTFRLYETDRGLHAYCTSHILDFQNPHVWTLMKQMRCDHFYIAFVAFRGFAMRLSPKPFDDVERRTPKTQAEFNSEFVKRPWLRSPVVGAVQEDLALVGMVDLCFQLSQFIITSIPNLYYRVNSNLEHDGLLRMVTTHALQRFLHLKSQFPMQIDAWLRARGTSSVPYINDVTVWNRSRAGNDTVRHPITGKSITVFEHDFAWKYSHDNEFVGPFPTREAARFAVEARFRGLQPTNVQDRYPSSSFTIHDDTQHGGYPHISTQQGAQFPNVSQEGHRQQGLAQQGMMVRNASEPDRQPNTIVGSTQQHQHATQTSENSVQLWSACQVAEWLASVFIGLPELAQQYRSAVLDVGIDGDMLMNDFDEVILEHDLHISVVAHRRKIMRARASLLSQQSS